MVFILYFSVDTVILRPYRYQVNIRDKAKFRAPPGFNPRRKAFKATSSRCCKIGEKTAKKRHSCNIGVYAVAQRLNSARRNTVKKQSIAGKRFSRALVSKITKCSVRYSKYFEKCCNYRTEYYKLLKQCKLLKRNQRRQCRKNIRRRYN